MTGKADKFKGPIHPKTFDGLLKDDQKPRAYHDGKGLYLIVGTGSQRSWLFKYRINGKSREMGLGSAHKVGLSVARDAHKLAVEMVGKGIDPKATRDEVKAEAKAAARLVEKSFYDLVPDAMKNPMVCEITGEDAARWWYQSLSPELTAGITAKPPQQITQADVATAILAIRERGSLQQAEKVRARFYRVFEWCAGKGYIAEDAINPASKFVGRHQAKLPKVTIDTAGQASIPYQQIRGVVAALRETEPRMSALCCEWILLSASRSANGTTAEWSEINEDQTVWTIPSYKMKESGHGAHRVPITDRMREILIAAAPPEGVERSALIFPNDSGEAFCGKTLVHLIRKVYPHLITREDGSKRRASIHGLRATFRTWGENLMEANGERHRFEEKMLELCLAHVVGDDARNAYVKENNVEVRRAIMNAWSDYLNGGKLIPFSKVA
jgi:integrase